ncbi:MAG TPA: hypothetical protein VF478_03840, partial [Anaerolineae bacterium]
MLSQSPSLGVEKEMNGYAICRGVYERIQLPRAVFHILLFNTSPAKAVIEKDIARWIQVTRQADLSALPKWRALVALLWRFQEFRNVFYYRVGKNRQITNELVMQLAKLTHKPMDTLYIWTRDIGPGLFIQHGFGTIISAKSIGEN